MEDKVFQSYIEEIDTSDKYVFAYDSDDNCYVYYERKLMMFVRAHQVQYIKDFLNHDSLLESILNKTNPSIIEEKNGRHAICFSKSGAMHRKKEDGPAYIGDIITSKLPNNETLKSYVIGFYENGELITNDIPGFIHHIETKGKKSTLEEFWSDEGLIYKIQRKNEEGELNGGPGIEFNSLITYRKCFDSNKDRCVAGKCGYHEHYTNGTRTEKKYYNENEQLHKDNGPAYILGPKECKVYHEGSTLVDLGKITEVVYYRHGKIHRNYEEGPAGILIVDAESGYQRMDYYAEEGKLIEIRRYNKEGNLDCFNDSYRSVEFKNFGSTRSQLHKSESIMGSDGSLRKLVNDTEDEDGYYQIFDNGKYMYTVYVDKDFSVHNEKGPAMFGDLSFLSGDEKSGILYYKHGLPHRLDGPAMTFGTKERYGVSFLEDGVFHREKGPAVFIVDEIEDDVRLMYYQANQLQREETISIKEYEQLYKPDFKWEITFVR